MKLGKIEKINLVSSAESNGIKNAEDSFLDKDFITEDDIREIANQISNEILNRQNGSDPALTIIDALRPEVIFRKIFNTGEKSLSETDLQVPLERIQKAIMERLSTKLNPETFNFILKKLDDDNQRIFELHGNKILKKGFHFGDNEEVDMFIVNSEKTKLETIHRLYALSERSPYIEYSLQGVTASSGEVWEIQNKLNFITLKELLDNNKPLISQTLSLLTDTM